MKVRWLATTGIEPQTDRQTTYLTPSTDIERSCTADERAVRKIEAQKAIRIPRNADPRALPDLAGFAVIVSQPQRAFAAKIEPIEPMIDSQRRGESSRSARQIA
jgi:hypothetical protein